MSFDCITIRPFRRIALRAGVASLLTVLGSAIYYIGIKLPNDREAVALANERNDKSFIISNLKLEMVWIAPGTFLMGTPEQKLLLKWFYAEREKLTKQTNPWHGEPEELPVTWVTLTQPFWLGRTAVTQAQYEQVMGTNPSHFMTAGREAPVEMVSWNDAMVFCVKLTELEREAGRLPVGYAYTLPTEAQREYACRAGATGDYAGELVSMAWYDKNSGGTTHPVMMKTPNAWGLYDMEGNVAEWCKDWNADKLPGGWVTNPHGPPSGDRRDVRGGCWESQAALCRSANRGSVPPNIRSDYIGFRLALAPVWHDEASSSVQ